MKRNDILGIGAGAEIDGDDLILPKERCKKGRHPHLVPLVPASGPRKRQNYHPLLRKPARQNRGSGN